MKSNPLSAQQHAYRTGKSTETALCELTCSLQYTVQNKEIGIGAFLDAEGAFDNATHKALGESLRRKNVEPMICNWTEHMLASRSAEVKVGDETIAVDTTRGCPQGGVLSPLLWSILVDELLVELTSKGITCQGYADDIVILALGRFESTLCDIIQRGINITSNWCEKVGLRLNPLKTCIVPFTRKRKLPNLRKIRVGGVEVDFQLEVKYLGVYLDNKLNWNRQIQHITNKAVRSLMTCRAYAGKTWGCKPSILRWLYTMIVIPSVKYWAIAWVDKTFLSTAKASLSKVQRLACLCITGATSTAPTAALEKILQLAPLFFSSTRGSKAYRS